MDHLCLGVGLALSQVGLLGKRDDGERPHVGFNSYINFRW